MKLRIQWLGLSPFLVSLCMCACISEAWQSQVTQGPEIKTANGYVRGKIVTTPTGKRVVGFYGIPFAQPPVGDLRFKRPEPVKSWDGVLNATQLPNSCSQVASKLFRNFDGEEMWNPNTPVSEDCLYLNIWVPEHIVNDGGRRTAKVLFWIYGGCFFSGTSTLDIYDGRILAGEQDVIVVSTQYRVGPLGFMYFGTEDAPGSMGLMDQNLALKWTHENIRAFGGDPDGVTLVGESTGAVSSSYHLLSPLSRPYFKQAILMSGAATAPFAFKTNAESLDVSIRLAKEFGCWSTESSFTEIASCMRTKEHEKISMVQFDLAKRFLEFSFGPTIDGHFLTDDPEHLITDPNTKRTNIMVGNVQDEGSYFIVYPFLSFYKSFHHLKSNNITYELLVSALNEVFKDRPAEERDAIVHHYTNWENVDDGEANQQKLVDAVGDAFFTCPVRSWADKWASRGLDVYYYFFTERTNSNPWGEWMGVLHGDEIEYMFGIPLSKPTKFDLAEQKLSRKMMELWANFAKTGSPSKLWSPYTQQQPFYSNLNSTVTTDQSLLNAYGPRSDACAFWNYYLPKLRRTVTEKQNTARNVLITHGYTCAPPLQQSALEDIEKEVCYEPKSAKFRHRHHHGKDKSNC